MNNQTDLHATYLNYHLSHKKAVTKKSTSLAAVLNLAIVFLIAIFFAQLLSAWRFEADARELITESAKKVTYQIQSGWQLLAVPAACAAEPISAGEAQPYTTNLVMKAGQETTVSLTFINKGQTTWTAGKTTLETGPFLKTVSKIYHKSWLKAFQVMTLPKNVKPGEKITLSFKVSGPEAQYIGVIQENFQLVAGEQPIKGSLARVFVDANQVVKAVVTNNVQVISTPIVKEAAKTTNNKTTTTIKVQYITAYNKLGEKVQVIKGQYVPGVSLTKPSAKAIAAEKARLAALSQVVTTPTTVVPAITTSTNSISDTYCIALSAAEREVSPQCQTSNNESQAGSGMTNFAKKLNEQPMIRVGLFDSTSTERVTSNKAFDIFAASNVLVVNVAAGTVASVNYSKTDKQYTVEVGGQTYQTKDYLRFVSQSGNEGVMQLPDYRNNPKWNANLNDNKFRNVLEYRYAPKTDKIWWINELPVDSYLKGMAETSNASPVEFHKIMATAARTYVLYHYYRGVDFGLNGASTKHADEFFHVDATYDQVYRGYNSEIRMPKMAQAVDQTAGAIVTYNNSLAITPYFSRSDGRTRSWSEVWGGDDKPWLQSVVVLEDSGKTLFGHGVGMSAQGALLMIVDGGKTWQTILSYFYQGTVLQKAY